VLTLVLGGTKAGKSSFAARLAQRTGRPVTVLATGVPGDREMRRRVAAHRRQRPPQWTVVEESLEIGRALTPGVEVVLLDSVDSWLFNRMERQGGGDANFTFELGAELVEACDRELDELATGAHVIAVTAEVGLSLLPMSPYGRAFTDLLGLLNQRLAARAERCYLMVAGIPVPLDRFREGP
jgi:adenosylcobinamide kinase / adenosylcobinamide-phosphate guanylyltransferase